MGLVVSSLNQPHCTPYSRIIPLPILGNGWTYMNVTPSLTSMIGGASATFGSKKRPESRTAAAEMSLLRKYIADLQVAREMV